VSPTPEDDWSLYVPLLTLDIVGITFALRCYTIPRAIFLSGIERLCDPDTLGRRSKSRESFKFQASTDEWTSYKLFDMCERLELSK